MNEHTPATAALMDLMMMQRLIKETFQDKHIIWGILEKNLKIIEAHLVDHIIEEQENMNE